MDESALRRALASLDDCGSSLHSCLKVATALVVIGVALEMVFVIWEYLEDLHDFNRGIVRPPDKPSWLLFALGFLGAALVAVGVGGELYAESKITTLETCIRKGNDTLSLLLSKEVSDANERASKNEKEAAQLRKDAEDEALARAKLQERVAWRSISPSDIIRIGSKLRAHTGVRIGIGTIAGNEEAVSFSEDIADVITIAHWQFSSVTPYGTLGIQKFGMDISTTRDDLSRTAAQHLRKELRKLGFNSEYQEADKVFTGGEAGIYLMVELRPRIVHINKTVSAKYRHSKP